MAPLWSLGLGWALRLVWAKVVRLIEHATLHHVPRLEAQGPTSLRPCTRGIIAMDFNEQWVWRGVAPHTPTIHIFLDLSNFYELLIQDIEITYYLVSQEHQILLPLHLCFFLYLTYTPCT